MTDEILMAAKAAQADNPAALTRQWLLEVGHGTLCTTSTHREMSGYPFGSVVPFALTPDGRPYILTADIAAHTKNLRADPRGSLFVQEPGVAGDPQRGWRVTVMGTWAPVEDESRIPELHSRYLERVPKAEGYLQTHSFRYWEMVSIEKVRYIGGFGKICWIAGDKLLRKPLGGGLITAAPGAVAHMNEDHAHNMVEMCTGLYGFTPASATMTSLDCTGFMVETTEPAKQVFFSFGKEITAAQLRHEVVAVLMRARKQQA